MADIVQTQIGTSKKAAKRWDVAPWMPVDIEEALNQYPRALRQVLYNRGIRTAGQADSYLRGEYLAALGDPFQMKDMRRAAERIQLAIRHREKIAVYGDYDVDGVTATALLTQVFRAFNADMIAYIPNRFDEGYGLNAPAIRELAAQGVTLIISVDCGIRSVNEAKVAKEVNVDLVITDHHEPGYEIPNAFAVINPKQINDGYPEKMLAGVGIAFKLAVAVMSLFPGAPVVKEDDLLDLVALGTVADVAPLKGENRSLVRRGMRQLRAPRRPGVIELIKVASVVPERLTSMDIGFRLGPRLNAAGRLESAIAAYRLLVSDDPAEIEELAKKLNRQNEERQQLTRAMHKTGIALVEAMPELPMILFVAQEDFNPGVVGLVASRLVESYYRPSIVGHPEGDRTIKASCRSIKGFNMNESLELCSDLLVRFGGHAAAAGLTIREECVPAFVERMCLIASNCLGPEDLIRTISADGEIPLSEVAFDLVRAMDLMQPTGAESPEPKFVTRNCEVISARAIGKEEAHLKLFLKDGNTKMDAVAFGFGHLVKNGPLTHVDVLYSVAINEYNGSVTLQLLIEDIVPVSYQQRLL